MSSDYFKRIMLNTKGNRTVAKLDIHKHVALLFTVGDDFSIHPFTSLEGFGFNARNVIGFLVEIRHDFQLSIKFEFNHGGIY